MNGVDTEIQNKMNSKLIGRILIVDLCDFV